MQAVSSLHKPAVSNSFRDEKWGIEKKIYTGSGKLLFTFTKEKEPLWYRVS